MIDFKRTIKSISYLKEDEREKIKVNDWGKFPLGLDLSVYPNEFVDLYGVSGNDPVLTLVDGDKVRVYYGGCSEQMLVQAAGIIDNHITFYEEARKNNKGQLPDPFDWREWSDYFGYTRGSD